ncbi:hypothetical protein ILYODFUR_030092 [Ilyodon furcidens]|uniref:Uncharacterized protein n=1 Tax=Ilyodon furcidens TaxID=33524 RepID=A0ABV0UMH8_9TELE
MLYNPICQQRIRRRAFHIKKTISNQYSPYLLLPSHGFTKEQGPLVAYKGYGRVFVPRCGALPTMLHLSNPSAGPAKNAPTNLISTMRKILKEDTLTPVLG